MVSERTKVCKRRKRIFNALHLLSILGPFLYFIPYSYIVGDITEKIALSFSVITAVILAAIGLFTDLKENGNLHKSIMWIFVAGVLFCLKEVQVFIWVMCIVSILDELVFYNLFKYYKTALISNKEQDKRG